MKLRYASAATLGLALALGTAGCNMITPQATTLSYTPTDGRLTEAGMVSVRNALLVVDQQDVTQGHLSAAFFNHREGSTQLTIQVGDVRVNVELPPGLTTFGNEGQQLLVSLPKDTVPGQTVNASFTEQGAEAVTTELQVFSSDLVGFEHLAPEPSPSPEPTPSPEPSVEPSIEPTPEF